MVLGKIKKQESIKLWIIVLDIELGPDNLSNPKESPLYYLVLKSLTLPKPEFL